MARDSYEVQTVSSAFAGRIPEHLWETVGRATTPRGAYRHYKREWMWYHPQQNAWSGHVRILRNGRQVIIDTYTLEMYDVD